MTDDIVEKLRSFGPDWSVKYGGRMRPIPYEVCDDAADEIERLRAKLDEWIAQASKMEAERDKARDDVDQLRAELDVVE